VVSHQGSEQRHFLLATGRISVKAIPAIQSPSNGGNTMQAVQVVLPLWILTVIFLTWTIRKGRAMMKSLKMEKYIIFKVGGMS
jgi:hypothetical protein